jgi:hypothetical protein
MSSKRLRSKKTIGTAVANLSSTVTKISHVGTPTDLSSQAITSDYIDNGAIYTSAITDGTIASRTLGLSSYVPSGEGVQRVPAPLSDAEYWEDVIDGLIELHKSGVHDSYASEDTKNVTVSTSGITFNPTGVAGGEARIFLTGRMPIPKSRKIYATWSSTASITLKAVYWTSVTPLLVTKVGISSGVVTVTTGTSHGLSVGDDVRITSCGADYDGIYNIASVPSATTFTYNAKSTATQDINENFLAVEGRAARDIYSYEYLDNKIAVEFVDTAGDYAVYAEVGELSSSRTLTEAKVFEIIGSGTTTVVSADIIAKSSTANVTEIYTAKAHGFKVDDIVDISGITDSALVTTYSVASGTPNVLKIYTSTPHGYTSGDTVTLANTTPTIIDGTYTIIGIPVAQIFTIYTGLAVTANVSVNTTATAELSLFSGQGKITSVSETISNASTTSYSVVAGGGSGSFPNTLTVNVSTNHNLRIGSEVVVSNSTPTVIDGTYNTISLPNPMSFDVATALPVTANTAVSAFAKGVDGIFTYNRYTPGGAYPYTVISPAGQAQVGKPRYSYISYFTSTASSYVGVYTTTAHGFSVGDQVTLSGIDITNDGVDGTYLITNLSSTNSKYFRATSSTSKPDSTYTNTYLTSKQAVAYVGNSEVKIEMGPDGLKYVGTTAGSVDTDLGTTADNFLGITRVDGKSVASIDNNGVGNFSSVVADSFITTGDISFDDVPLVNSFGTAQYNGTNYTGGLLDRLARGVVYKGTFSINSGVAVATQFYSLAYGTFILEPNRHYAFNLTTGGLRATPTTNALFELCFSTEPQRGNSLTTPKHNGTLWGANMNTAASPLYGSFYTGNNATSATNVSISTISRATTVLSVSTATAHGLVVDDWLGISDVAGANAVSVTGTFQVASVVNTTAFTCNTSPTTGTLTGMSGGVIRKVNSILAQTDQMPAGIPIYYLLRVRHGLVPTSYTVSHSAASGIDTPQMEFTVSDIGQAKPSANVTKVGIDDALLTLAPNSPAGGGGGGTVRTTYTVTQTVTASDSGYYDNYGRGTGTTDPYAYKYSLYQGNPGTASGTKKSAVLFPTFTAPPSGAANVNVTSVQVYLRNRHSYSASGLTAYLGVHTSTSLGSSVPSGNATAGVTTSSFTKGQGKWVSLPTASRVLFKPGTQTARGVLVGLTATTATWYSSISNYGYFDGNTMADEPQLKVTYTYDL